MIFLRKCCPVCLVFFLITSCQPKTTDEVKEEKQPAPVVQKSDLSKARWMEGNWKGEYQGKPFYETYSLMNDSTMAITSYIHTGTDSAAMETSYVMWADSAYYLGSQKNYIVIRMDEKEIAMVPHYRARNEIVWTYRDDSTWSAVLSGMADTLRYTMTRIHNMDSLLMKKTE